MKERFGLIERQLHLNQVNGGREQSQTRFHPATSLSKAQTEVLTTLCLDVNERERKENLVGLGFGFLALITDSLATHPLRLARWRAQIMNRNRESIFSFFSSIAQTRRYELFWQGFGSRVFGEVVCFSAERQFCDVFQPPEKRNTFFSIFYHISLNCLSFLWTFPLHRATILLGLQYNLFPTQRRFRGLGHCIQDYGLYFNYPNLLPPNRLPLPTIALPVIFHYFLRNIFYRFLNESIYQKLQAAEDSDLLSQPQLQNQNGIESGNENESESENENEGNQSINHGLLLNESIYDNEEPKKRKSKGSDDSWKTMLYIIHPKLFASFLGMILSQFIVFPLEVISNRLIAQGTGVLHPSAETYYTGFLDCVLTVWKQQGILGFYTGCDSMIVRFLVSAAILELIQGSQSFISYIFDKIYGPL